MISEAVNFFSRIDQAIVECIWALERADLQKKRKIAKANAHENIEYVRGVVSSTFGSISTRPRRRSRRCARSVT